MAKKTLPVLSPTMRGDLVVFLSMFAAMVMIQYSASGGKDH
jgi:hypothetical protein